MKLRIANNQEILRGFQRSIFRTLVCTIGLISLRGPWAVGQDAGLVVIGDDGSQVITYPLRSMKIEGRMVDGVVEVSMTQEFETIAFDPVFISVGEGPIEGDGGVVETKEASKTTSVYQLPLDEKAAVTAFTAEVGDRVIEAVVKERNEARKEFEEAVEAGQNAFLAEQTRADIFRISVGNLPPGKIARVTLVYIAPLDAIEGDTLRFILPTNIAPRFEPLENSEGVIPGGEALINSGVQISLDVLTSNPLEDISSPTHKIDVSTVPGGDRDTTEIVVVDEDPLRSDVVILLKILEDNQPKIYMEEASEEDGTIGMMLSLVPDIPGELESDAGVDNAEAIDREFVFIVDRSGSMSGGKIRQLRQALRFVVETFLSEQTGSLVNVVGFGNNFKFLFKEGSRPLDEKETIDEVLDHIDGIEADFGGTNILGPIRAVLGEEPLPGFDRIVFVFTDGQVSNTDDVIEFVEEHRASSRVFSLGIGGSVSRLLVNGIARAGRGSSDFVDGFSEAEIRRAVLRQMDIVLTPSLSDVVVDWGFGEDGGLQAPFLPPPLLNNRRFLMFFLRNTAATESTGVDIGATVFSTGDQIGYNVDASEFVTIKTDAGTMELLQKMAARELIRDLEEGRSELHTKDRPPREIDDEIVRIGVQYQIASSLTSFVAVDNEGKTEILEESRPSSGGDGGDGGDGGGGGFGGTVGTGGGGGGGGANLSAPGGSGSVGGDPHFSLWDGSKYSYHGGCDLVMVDGSHFDGTGIRLHVRTKIRRESFSVVSNAALQVGEDILEVANDGTYYLNKVLRHTPPTSLGVYKVRQLQGSRCMGSACQNYTGISVDLLGGAEVKITIWKRMLYVNVVDGIARLEGSRGLMGQWGKVAGLVGRDGSKIFDNFGDYAEEWQVQYDEPMLFYKVQGPQHPQACRPPPTRATARRLGGARRRRRAERACSHAAESQKEMCIFDVMMTGDPEVALGPFYGDSKEN